MTLASVALNQRAQAKKSITRCFRKMIRDVAYSIHSSLRVKGVDLYKLMNYIIQLNGTGVTKWHKGNEYLTQLRPVLIAWYFLNEPWCISSLTKFSKFFAKSDSWKNIRKAIVLHWCSLPATHFGEVAEVQTYVVHAFNENLSAASRTKRRTPNGGCG